MIAEALLCMALNVYHEARGEPLTGQEAVALVTRNRAEMRGTSVCWEVFRYKQFSWTLFDSNLEHLPQGKSWEEALRVARWALEGAPDFTHGATHYHATDVHPYWAATMKRTGKWGSHVFYRGRLKRAIIPESEPLPPHTAAAKTK